MFAIYDSKTSKTSNYSLDVSKTNNKVKELNKKAGYERYFTQPKNSK